MSFHKIFLLFEDVLTPLRFSNFSYFKIQFKCLLFGEAFFHGLRKHQPYLPISSTITHLSLIRFHSPMGLGTLNWELIVFLVFSIIPRTF